MLHELQQLADVVAPSSLLQPVCRDADDDEVLAVAIASQADCIITGDDDLLSLKSYQGIPIMLAKGMEVKSVEFVKQGRRFITRREPFAL